MTLPITPLTMPLPTNRWRAVIVDDEPVARRGIRLLLEREVDIEVVGEATDGAAGEELIRQLRPEIAFVDVQMPGCDGFEMLRRFTPDSIPVVVFVTAYDEYAIKAFDTNAVDYLLKPYEDDRFAAALQRAKEKARHRRGDQVDAKLSQLLSFLQQGHAERPGEASDRILVKSSGEIIFLRPDEIDWIEAEGDYMKFHASGRTHLMRETMARLEAKLDPKRFVRIHRSTIVNIDRLRKLTPTFGGEYTVVLHDGTKLRLSRGFHDRIASLLKQSL